MNNTQKALINQDVCEQTTPNLGITQSSGLEEQTVNGHTVLCKGNDGLIYTATWTDGEYSYAVMCDSGMSVGQLTAWVETLA